MSAIEPLRAAPAFRLRSRNPDGEYSIYEHVPREPGPWPVILFMDGDDQFHFAVDAYRELRGGGRVRPLLLVGVGYGASYTKPGNRRVRDYTPTAVATEPDSGGAGAFIRFLAEDLWRALARRHPISEELRGIGGHSLGSLAALEALFRPEPFFNRALASAPSLWWDDRAVLTRLDALERGSRAGPSSRLFLAVGEDDTPSMTGDLRMLESRLADRPVPGIDVISGRFPGRDHYNVLPEAFREGLAALFA